MSLTVTNVPNTSHLRAIDICGCPSWVEHWRRHSGSERTSCMGIDCQNPVVLGAHIKALRGRTVYIIGLCRRCNHHTNADRFEVDQRTGWAPSGYLVGCGVFDELEPGDIVRCKPRDQVVYELSELIESEGDEATWWAVPVGKVRRVRITFCGEEVRRAR